MDVTSSSVASQCIVESWPQEGMKKNDCSFLVGDDKKIIYGDRLALAMSSPVFKNILYDQKSRKNEPILIPYVGFRTFNAMLTYINDKKYTLQSLSESFDMYKAAKMYAVKDLMWKCILSIKIQSNNLNVCKIYKFALNNFENELLDETKKYFCRYTKDILGGCCGIEELEIILPAIYGFDDLDSDSELFLFEALEMFSERSRAPYKNIIIRLAVKEVRFLLMTPEEFEAGPAKSNILSQIEKDKLRNRLKSNDPHSPMPEGFTSSTCSRHPIHWWVNKENCNGLWESFNKFPTLTIKLTTDTAILLLGIQISTRWGQYFEVYEENISVHLRSSTNKILAACNYKRIVEYETYQTIFFDIPYCVRAFHMIIILIISNLFFL